MTVKLTFHQHGKGRVRLLKVDRRPDGHIVFQIDAEILLKGPADAAFLSGDNRNVLPTDSVKNTVYALAKIHEFQSIEDFGVILAKHFVTKHANIVNSAEVKLKSTEWKRLVTPNTKGVMQPHQHAFIANGTGTPFTKVIVVKESGGREPKVTVFSGVDGLKVLKTTKSGFVNFFRDEFTTLSDVPDRLLETVVNATWKYLPGYSSTSYAERSSEVSRALLEAFAGPADVGVDSPAVQYTLYKMGEAVIEKCPTVSDISLSMPNVHNLPVDLSRFGLQNKHPHGEIFVPTDEPHGIIEATVARSNSRL